MEINFDLEFSQMSEGQGKTQKARDIIAIVLEKKFGNNIPKDDRTRLYPILKKFDVAISENALTINFTSTEIKILNSLFQEVNASLEELYNFHLLEFTLNGSE